VARINVLLAHAWMVRTFLKHADEIQDDADMLEVPRMIFDYTRAVEPSAQRGDLPEFLRRARGKLPKLRRVAEFFTQEYRRVSDHTNFQMAAVSLQGVVAQLEEVLAQLPPAAGPEDLV
jgi:alkylhydroperoxidase family enzyme